MISLKKKGIHFVGLQKKKTAKQDIPTLNIRNKKKTCPILPQGPSNVSTEAFL